jgi:hypothetical protein
MELIKNYSSWLDQGVVQYLENRTGDTVPVWQPDRWKGHPDLDAARERARIGYSNNIHFFQQFNINSPDMQDFKLTIPDIEHNNRRISWWFIKLLPGQMQTMHFDPHLLSCVNPTRYTLFLQDWQPGHIFTYADRILVDYKAGDLYKWSDPMCYHGVVNIGYSTRYTLQITTHE